MVADARAPASPRPVTEGSSLRIVEVSKHFPTPDDPEGQMTALQGVTLSIAPGELAGRRSIFGDQQISWLGSR